MTSTRYPKKAGPGSPRRTDRQHFRISAGEPAYKVCRKVLPENLHTRFAGRSCRRTCIQGLPEGPARGVRHGSCIKKKKNRDKLRRRFLCADPAAEVRGRYCPMKKKISRNCRLISLMNRQFAGVFSVFHLEQEMAPFRKPVIGAAAFQKVCNRGCCLSGDLRPELPPFRLSVIGAAARLVFLHEADILVGCFFVGKNGGIVLVAHLVPHELRHPLAHDDAVSVFFHNLLV